MITQEQLEFIPILIGIYVVLLTTYWFLKKMPVWFNKPERLLNRKQRKLVKKMLYYLEETDFWEEGVCFGLCDFAIALRLKDLFVKKELEIFYSFKADFNPSKIYFKEYLSYGAYWFEPKAKQPRIDYLKKLLNSQNNKYD